MSLLAEDTLITGKPHNPFKHRMPINEAGSMIRISTMSDMVVQINCHIFINECTNESAVNSGLENK